MSALAVKLAMAAGASLLLLVPAFNSLNQVTVQDVRPPLTLNDPPNVPPPDVGDDQQIDVKTEEGPQPTSPDCPPPAIEEATPRLFWEPPQIPREQTAPFSVEPGSLGIGVNYNIDQFAGHVVISVVNEQLGDRIIVHEWSSVNSGGSPEDPDRFDQQDNVTYEIRGAVPGSWTLSVDVAAPEPQQGVLPLLADQNTVATGHVDAQVYQAFACGGAGRDAAPSRAARADDGGALLG